MKAEFEKHECTFLLYPERKDVWRKKCAPIRKVIENLALTISEYEPVHLGYKNAIPKISALPMIYDDIWCRDTGPIPAKNGDLISFNFDGWGGEMIAEINDDKKLPGQIATVLGKKLNEIPLVLEGGNITCDGNGTILLIEHNLVNSNKDMSLAKIEECLRQSLNIRQIIWLPRGLKFDETGGHIDNIASFADARTILLSFTNDMKHPQYEIVNEAFSILKNAKDINGNPYQIVKVPIPDIFFTTKDDCADIEIVQGSKPRIEGLPIQASYINFIFANGAVIVPQFNLPQDNDALSVFKKVFTNRKVIPSHAREVVLGGGGLHCISRNI